MNGRTSFHRALGLLAAAFATGACSDGGPPGAERISINFEVVGLAAPASLGATASAPARVAGPPLSLEGTNGTLTLEEVLIVIAEAELDGEDDSCENPATGVDSDCAEFEAPPRFLDLPLDGQPIEAFEAMIPPGVYDEFEFEVEDLDDDETDPTLAAQIEALRMDILSIVPDWHREASVQVSGTFTPTGGSPASFRVMLEAEIEIEMDLSPPLVVGEDGVTSRDVTVEIAPALWFTNADGTVMDLTAYDYDTTGQLLEFELEMEDGFLRVEFDD